MQEFDLNAMWEQGEEQADTWYRQLRPELVSKAQQQKDDALHRIRRLIELELGTGGLLFVIILYLAYGIPLLMYIGIIVLFSFMLIISYRYYRRFKQTITTLPTLDIVSSIEAYITQLNNYKKRLIQLSIGMIPASLIVGFLAGFGLGTANNYDHLYQASFWWKAIPLFLIAAVICYVLIRWYYNFFIGQQERNLQNMLDRLKAPEEE